MYSVCNSFRMLLESVASLNSMVLVLSLLILSEAQLSAVQQIHFVPKSYFLQASASEPLATTTPADITRNPRHLAPDRYYVGPVSDQDATATTSLRGTTLDRAGNPIDFNPDLDQELKLEISNHNPNNNQFEAKILSSPSQAIPSRKSTRGKPRRTKNRPPKNVIIYSLPEQSFFAAGDDNSNNDSSSYSGEDSRESNPGLRSDLGEDIVEQQPTANSKEFRETSSSSNLLSQKKALLHQCMAQCIDAIL